MAKICEICCEFIVLQDKRNTRYMDNGNENNISGREKFDMKAWMEESSGVWRVCCGDGRSGLAGGVSVGFGCV